MNNQENGAIHQAVTMYMNEQ